MIRAMESTPTRSTRLRGLWIVAIGVMVAYVVVSVLWMAGGTIAHRGLPSC